MALANNKKPLETGSRYGRWTVGAPAAYTYGRTLYQVQCDCGEKREIDRYHLITGKSRSCGCLRSEIHRTHGLSNASTYKIWSAMHQRCHNPNNVNYRLYGARGISVCERWASFENFFADMGDKPKGRSIDRINNDGNYEPSNCRWADGKMQAQNSRRVLLSAKRALADCRRLQAEWPR